MTSNIVLIAAVEAEEAANSAGPDAEAKLLAAMKAVQHHWLATSEDDQILAACEGAARSFDPDDLERLKAELQFFQSLSAASSGVPVNFSALLPDEGEERPKPIGISRLWREAQT